MHQFRLLASFLVIGALAWVTVSSQTGPAGNAVVYEGARLIIGPAATPTIDNGAFVVQGGMAYIGASRPEALIGLVR